MLEFEIPFLLFFFPSQLVVLVVLMLLLEGQPPIELIPYKPSSLLLLGDLAAPLKSLATGSTPRLH